MEFRKSTDCPQDIFCNPYTAYVNLKGFGLSEPGLPKQINSFLFEIDGLIQMLKCKLPHAQKNVHVHCTTWVENKIIHIQHTTNCVYCS